MSDQQVEGQELELPDPEPEEAPLPLFERYPALSIGIGMSFVVLAFFLTVPGMRFLSVTNVTNIMLDASQILILATAMTFVIIAAGIDLSIGSTLVLSSVVAAISMAYFSGTPEEILAFEYPNAAVGIPLGIACGILIGALCGLLNGLLIAKSKLPPFIVTLGTTGLYLGAALLITNGTNTPYVPPDLQRLFGAARIGGIVPVPVIIALTIAVLGGIVLAFTRFGVHTYAIGANAEGARLSGIDVEKHLVILYVLAGVCAAIAGVVDVARFNTTSVGAHTTDNLQAIAAVVLGGTSLFGGIGTMSGTVVGAFFPALLNNGFIQLGLQPFWKQAVIGVVLILAVYQDTLRRARTRRG